MNRHLRALAKTFAMFGLAGAIAQTSIWLLEAFGAWFPLSISIAIIFYGVYRLCLDED
jgi:hypothetical protein